MDRSKIKVLFVDWNGTLCTDLFWQQLNNTATCEIYNNIQQYLFMQYDDTELIKDWMRNKYSMNDIIDIVYKKFGYDKTFLKKELIYSLIDTHFVDTDVLKVIKQLQEKGLKVVIASDNMDVFKYTSTKLDLDLIFDDVLLSNELGYLKTDLDENNNPLFFARYFEKYNIKREECVLIDDSNTVCNLYDKIGFNYIKINNCRTETIEILKSFL